MKNSKFFLQSLFVAFIIATVTIVVTSCQSKTEQINFPLKLVRSVSFQSPNIEPQKEGNTIQVYNLRFDENDSEMYCFGETGGGHIFGYDAPIDFDSIPDLTISKKDSLVVNDQDLTIKLKMSEKKTTDRIVILYRDDPQDEKLRFTTIWIGKGGYYRQYENYTIKINSFEITILKNDKAIFHTIIK